MSDQQAARDDGFYVGYLPAPIAHLRLLRIVLPIFTVIIVGCGVLAASQMPRPGEGVWNTGAVDEWTGTLRLDPYPRLVADGLEGQGPGDAGESILLVEMGKFGAGRAAPRDLQALAGARVRVRGYWLARDGRRMIELDAPDDAIAALATVDGGDPAGSTNAVSLGAAVVTGEIVDYKCYLGAMRPGDGLLHRACAQLCVSGGIPPVLVSHDADGTPRYDVLVGVTGEALNVSGSPVIPYIGRPVEVRGERYEWDGLSVLRVAQVRATASLDPGRE